MPTTERRTVEVPTGIGMRKEVESINGTLNGKSVNIVATSSLQLLVDGKPTQWGALATREMNGFVVVSQSDFDKMKEFVKTHGTAHQAPIGEQAYFGARTGVVVSTDNIRFGPSAKISNELVKALFD